MQVGVPILRPGVSRGQLGEEVPAGSEGQLQPPVEHSMPIKVLTEKQYICGVGEGGWYGSFEGQHEGCS